MKRISACLVLLLFMAINTEAKAEDTNSYLAGEQKKQRRTEKIIGILHAAGLTHPMIAETAEYVRNNSRDDYFYFAEDDYKTNAGTGLKMGLRHEMGTPKLERFEIFLQEDGSNYIYTMSPEAAMMRYKSSFNW